MGVFDINDPFYEERDFETVLRINRAHSRAAWRLSLRNPEPILARLDALGHSARVRAIAAVFGWSKPTVMKFVHLGLLQRKRRPRGSPPGRPIEIEIWTARWLVGLCRRVLQDHPPLNRREHSRVRARLEAEGTNGTYHSLPPRLSVCELARFLRCAPITVRRMIDSGVVHAKRRTPCRWEFQKKRLPWWCREKK